MTITTADARNILNRSLADTPAVLNPAVEKALDAIVPEGESKDYYRGMMAGMMLAHGSLDGADLEELAQALTTFRIVAAKCASHIVD